MFRNENDKTIGMGSVHKMAPVSFGDASMCIRILKYVVKMMMEQTDVCAQLRN